MDDGFITRLRYIWSLIKPTNLFITDDQLERSKVIVDNPSNVSIEELEYHKSVIGSILHPDTGERIFMPFRMSCFVPTNLVVTAGLLVPNPSISTLIFWQIANQSINVGFNLANSNKSHPTSISDTLRSYTLAVFISCSIANILNHIGKRQYVSPWIARLSPFAAVSSANIVNVYSTRWNEIKYGISVTDEQGTKYGQSIIAAKSAIAQTAISRVATAFPILVISPLIMNRLEQTHLLRSYPRLWIPLQLGVISILLMTVLPCALSLFPPKGRISIKDLESDIANSLPHNRYSFLYFNKGL